MNFLERALSMYGIYKFYYSQIWIILEDKGQEVRNPLGGLSGHGSSLEESEARAGVRFLAG
jgi:hypothetical protein